MGQAILTFNAGSSTLKWALFEEEGCIARYRGCIDHLTEAPELSVFDAENRLQERVTIHYGKEHYESVFCFLLSWLGAQNWDLPVVAVGHRLVHSGLEFTEPVAINKEVLAKLEALIPLAPLHMPNQIEDIQSVEQFNPGLLQVACFDTSFHRSQSKIMRLFGLPQNLSNEGIVRYGFHGLSYASLVEILPEHTERAQGRAVLVHLGGGASACAVRNGQSVASTTGFSVLDGMMMGTRCGTLDPGVVVYLIEKKGLSVQKVRHLLYEESGLLGVSGLSADLRVLESSDDPNAQLALDLFCYRAASEIAALIPALSGIDLLVFTAGIGENSPLVRDKICSWLKFLGIALDTERNQENASRIHSSESRVEVLVLPTDEERAIAHATQRVFQEHRKL